MEWRKIRIFIVRQTAISFLTCEQYLRFWLSIAYNLSLVQRYVKLLWWQRIGVNLYFISWLAWYWVPLDVLKVKLMVFIVISVSWVVLSYLYRFILQWFNIWFVDNNNILDRQKVIKLLDVFLKNWSIVCILNFFERNSNVFYILLRLFDFICLRHAYMMFKLSGTKYLRIWTNFMESIFFILRIFIDYVFVIVKYLYIPFKIGILTISARTWLDGRITFLVVVCIFKGVFPIGKILLLISIILLVREYLYMSLKDLVERKPNIVVINNKYTDLVLRIKSYSYLFQCMPRTWCILGEVVIYRDISFYLWRKWEILLTRWHTQRVVMYCFLCVEYLYKLCGLRQYKELYYDMQQVGEKLNRFLQVYRNSNRIKYIQLNIHLNDKTFVDMNLIIQPYKISEMSSVSYKEWIRMEKILEQLYLDFENHRLRVIEKILYKYNKGLHFECYKHGGGKKVVFKRLNPVVSKIVNKYYGGLGGN